MIIYVCDFVLYMGLVGNVYMELFKLYNLILSHPRSI
jgi:hypothetical protein